MNSHSASWPGLDFIIRGWVNMRWVDVDVDGYTVEIYKKI